MPLRYTQVLETLKYGGKKFRNMSRLLPAVIVYIAINYIECGIDANLPFICRNAI